ncbi:MAG: bifunctional riboflavin kinase/FAD synthetase [Bacteroidota bacterium]|nr:bifunctional riboflavin kinase/FAD synthetase [Bacteroidota bacterium]
MKIYHSISDFKNVQKPILTTGTFDGVHFGHIKIIQRLSEIAVNEGGQSTVLTFYPHPRMVLFPGDHQLQLINTLEEKIRLLKKARVQHLIIHPFTKEFSRKTSLSFVRDIIVNQLNTHKLVIGYDHHFGRNREGTFEHLKEFAPVYGFEVEEIPAQLLDDVKVSSTKIRNALVNGQVDLAYQFLNYHYELSGTVVKGNEVGRRINFPTANLSVDDATKLIPKPGVYAVKVDVQNHCFDGMMNIGTNPTLGNNKQSIEVHIFEFDNLIYDQKIGVRFIHRMRDEVSFYNLESLKQQLEKDKQIAKDLLA